MKLFRSAKITKEAENSVLVIGNFDGVHLGHQSVINYARKIAKKKKKMLSVLTFEPHPKCFFASRYHGFRLTPFKKKFELLRNLGVDFYINIFFSKSFAKISSEDFIFKILNESLKVNHVITGFDFVFGYKQKGNVDLIKKISFNKKIFDFSVVDDFKKDSEIKISSSEIRKYLIRGKVEEVENLLGRRWSVKSRVKRGMKIGSEIGFPTANLSIRDYCDMCFGVYKVQIKFRKDLFQSAFTGIANYGIKPTFSNFIPVLEVNIFDFNKNIYDEIIEVFFISFIRKEKKFESVDELKIQIKKDISICKNNNT